MRLCFSHRNIASNARTMSSRRMGRILAVVTLIVGSIVVTTTSSSADPNCTYPACSSIANQSQYGVLVAHDWSGNGERLYQNEPPKGWGSANYWLAPGDGTHSHEDWDTFRVDAGFCYKIRTWNKLGHNSSQTINRIGQSTGVWVRVHNNEIANITHQSSSSC